MITSVFAVYVHSQYRFLSRFLYPRNAINCKSDNFIKAEHFCKSLRHRSKQKARQKT